MLKYLTATGLLVGAGLLSLGLAAGARAQTAPGTNVTTTHAAKTDPDAPVGKQAGTFMVRLRAIGILPQVTSSDVSVIGGHIEATNQPAPELDLSYFITDHIAVEAIAASTRHTITATDTALGNIKVGSVWVLPPTVTLQYHFMPHRRFSPYVGAGLNATFFYDTTPSGPTVTKLGFDNNVGGVLQIGADYNVAGHWFLNADVKQIFVSTTAHLNGNAIEAHTALNPTVVGLGIGYRF